MNHNCINTENAKSIMKWNITLKHNDMSKQNASNTSFYNTLNLKNSNLYFFSYVEDNPLKSPSGAVVAFANNTQ